MFNYKQIHLFHTINYIDSTPLLGTMTPSKLYTIAPNSNYAPSISIISICLCLAPNAGLQQLLDSYKVCCPPGYYIMCSFG